MLQHCFPVKLQKGFGDYENDLTLGELFLEGQLLLPRVNSVQAGKEEKYRILTALAQGQLPLEIETAGR